jgi:RimJ/RimL family protein N-acetyltransferase
MRFQNYITEQSNIKVFIKKPSDCSKEEKRNFIELVVSGNQNTPSHVRNSFNKLVWVGLLYEDDEIKAVSSLKKGDPDIFDRAESEEDPKDYPYEVGFSFTDHNSRGKGFNKILKKELFDKVGNRGIYATIRVTNKESMAVNTKIGFRPVGKPWKGIATDVQLWVLD